MHDRALMQLIIATLSPMAKSCIIGSRSSHEMWVNLAERFSIVTKATIFQMKTELQNIKKGSESVSIKGRESLILLKDFRSQLLAEETTIGQDFDSSPSFGSAMVAGTAINKGKALVLDQDSSNSVEVGSSSGTNDHNYKSNGNDRFTSFLPALGFKPSHGDPSLFVHHSHQGIVVLLLYVDDVILTGSSS